MRLSAYNQYLSELLMQFLLNESTDTVQDSTPNVDILLSDCFQNLQNGLSQKRDVEFDHALLLIEDIRADHTHQGQSSVAHDRLALNT
jgi:hypothetical protein